MAKVLLLMTLPATDPLVPPLPSCNMPRIDHGAAEIGVDGCENSGAGTVLLERAGSGNDAAQGEGIGVIDRKRAIIEDVAGDRSARSAVAELQRAGIDRGAAEIGVGGGEDGRAGAVLLERAGSGNDAAQGEVSERLIASVPLSRTLPMIEPLVPPLPSCSVPALMVVPPR